MRRAVFSGADVIRIPVLALLCGSCVFGSCPQDPEERLRKALDGTPETLARAVEADRPLVFGLAMGLLTDLIGNKSEGKKADPAPVRRLIGAFAALSKPTPVETRQFKTLRDRLAMAESLSEKDARLYCDALGWVEEAAEKRRNGKPDEAEKDLRKAIETMKKFGDRGCEAHALNRLAVHYSHVYRRLEAVECLEQACAIQKETGERWKEETTLRNLGLLYGDLGRLRESLRCHELSLEGARDVGDKRDEATAIHNIGRTYKNMGRFSEAARTLEGALNIEDEASSRGRTLGTLGQVYEHLGEFAEALRCMEAALKLSRQAEDGLAEIVALEDLGSIYGRLGRPQEALKYHEQSLKLARDQKRRPEEGSALGAIGLDYMDLGRLPEALENLERSLDLARDMGDRTGTAVLLGNIGWVYRRMGEYEKALRYFERDLQVVQEIGDREGEGEAFYDMGLAYARMNQLNQALLFFQKALNIRRECGDREGEASALGCVGGALLDLGKVGEAADRLAEAVRAAEVVRASIGALQTEKAAWMARHRWLYELAVACRITNHQPEQAVALLEQMRSRVLLDTLGQTEAAGRGVPPKAMEKKLSLSKSYNALKGEQIGLTKAFSTAQGPDRDRLAAEIDRVRKEVGEAEDDLVKAAHEIELRLSVEEVAPLGPREIQRSLKEDEAFLAYTVASDDRRGDRMPREKIIAVAATRKSLDIVELPWTKEDGENLGWLRQAAALSSRGYPAAQFRKRAHGIYRALLERFQRKLADEAIRRLAISPDEFLYAVPWESLTVSEEGNSYSDLDYLGARYEIRLVSSGTLLAGRRDSGARPGARLIAFGDPDYGSLTAVGSRGPAALKRPASVPEDLRSFVEAEPDSERGGWSRLPHSGEEAREIAALFKAEPRLGKDASERSAKEIENARIVHFACHGTVDAADPMKSALVLTADKENDGYLEAREIAGLKLPCELVVLSACDSGSGEMLRGEGLIGLTRAFMMAGARSVIASLWTVSDEGGKEFMIAFYKKLAAGKGKLEALSETKREFIKREKYSAPYYWAGFVLHGE